MTDYFQIGVITNSHGIRGEVKVIPTTDDPKRFEKIKKVTLIKEHMNQELTIESVRYFKQFVLLKFKDYNSINEIEGFKRGSLQVSREHALPLERDEYYIRDLIGLKVVTDEEEVLGHIKEVLPTGSNEVYVVFNKEEQREILLPAIKDCILDVNIQEGYVKVHVMKGLMD
jgi:16S rRNA processing protein RimM